MFFACHFFHQCVLGSCFGITISQFLQHRKINRFLTEIHRLKGIILGVAVLILCIAVYYAHFIMAKDPQWAVKKVSYSPKKNSYNHFNISLKKLLSFFN